MKFALALAIAATVFFALSAASDDVVETLVLAPEMTTNATTSSGTRTLRINARPSDACMMADDVDFIGGDLTSTRGWHDTCCNQCKRNLECVGYSWTNYQGGTCWLKRSVNNAQVYPGAKACIIAKDPTEVTYAAFSNCDMPGNDVHTSRAANVQSCVSTCLKLWKCEAITWTNYQGGTCWYKSHKSKCVSYKGATSITLFEF